ncbi:MAG: putative Ig domain-containing protein [Nitrososphaerota archaeon]
MLKGRKLISLKGFTLIELAIVLVVIGILVSLGVGMIGMLTKQAKLRESREIVKAAREAVIGYAVKNGHLPANLETAGARKLDAWGNDLLYYPTTEFDASPKDACGVTTTAMEVRECTDTGCTSYHAKSNIAFVILSVGPDGNNGTGTVSPFTVRLQDDAYTSGGTTYYYDDIVAYASLDEIRTLRGCPQPLAITSPSTLPQGEEDSFYSYSLQAIGGKPPYTWSGSVGSGLGLSSAGLISGTINVNTATNTGELTACSASITVNATVTDSAGSPPQNYTGSIPVRPKPLTIITQSLPAAYEGSPYSATITASGGRTPYSWSMSVSPSCPPGLTCSGNSISGTPASGTAGTYTVTSIVNDNCTTSAKNFVLTINPSGGGGGGGGGGCDSFRGWTQNLPNATNCQWYSGSIRVIGGVSPYTWELSLGSLPNGINFCTDNRSDTCTLTGTPIANPGPYNFTVTVRDSCQSGSQSTSGAFSITVTDSCYTAGIRVRNQSGGRRYYRRNGGACTAWDQGAAASITVLPTDSYEIYSNNTCTTPYCVDSGNQPLKVTYCQQKPYDTDGDCQTRMNAGCSFADW